jgi:hypothetical protein
MNKDVLNSAVPADLEAEEDVEAYYPVNAHFKQVSAAPPTPIV